MGRYQSAEEIKKEHLEVFGPELGPIYHAIHHEILWLHAKWAEYRKLFAHSQDRVNLLNDSAAHFFGVVQVVLWNDILLHICRLTDPLGTGKRENLSLDRLREAVPSNRKELRGDLKGLVKLAEDCSQFARELRNKYLAHLDFPMAIDATVTPLPHASQQDVEDALTSFRDVMNSLRAAYEQGEVAFERILTKSGGDSLIHHLTVSARSDKHQREQLQQGKNLPEDF